MAEYRDKTFTNQDLVVSGHTFSGCTFDGCRLIYTGVGDCELIASTMRKCRWAFDGPAASTMQFLAQLYHECGPEGRRLVDETFAEVRRKR